jgi:hypothetical protein
VRLSTHSKLRCAYAIEYEDNRYTRCMLKPAHFGPHEGRGLKKLVYQRVKWFQGDGREFITDKPHEWAWSQRGQKVKDES